MNRLISFHYTDLIICSENNLIPASLCPASCFLSLEDEKLRQWTNLEAHRPARPLPGPSRENQESCITLVIPVQWGKLQEPYSVLYRAESSLCKASGILNMLSNCSHYACNKGHFNPSASLPPFV